MQEYEHTGWQYSGTTKDFMHLIRWALVFQDLAGEGNENLMDVVRDKDRIRKCALSKGMTLRAIAAEMQTAAKATTDMLNEMEKHRCDN